MAKVAEFRTNLATRVVLQSFGRFFIVWDRAGGLLVIMLAFFSNNLSLNLAFCKFDLKLSKKEARMCLSYFT